MQKQRERERERESDQIKRRKIQTDEDKKKMKANQSSNGWIQYIDDYKERACITSNHRIYRNRVKCMCFAQ